MAGWSLLCSNFRQIASTFMQMVHSLQGIQAVLTHRLTPQSAQQAPYSVSVITLSVSDNRTCTYPHRNSALVDLSGR